MSLHSMFRPTGKKAGWVSFACGGNLVSPVPMISGVGEGLCIRARLSSLSPVTLMPPCKLSEYPPAWYSQSVAFVPLNFYKIKKYARPSRHPLRFPPLILGSDLIHDSKWHPRPMLFLSSVISPERLSLFQTDRSGANRGIGFELASRLHRQGYTVFGTYRPQHETTLR